MSKVKLLILLKKKQNDKMIACDLYRTPGPRPSLWLWFAVTIKQSSDGCDLTNYDCGVSGLLSLLVHEWSSIGSLVSKIMITLGVWHVVFLW